MTENDINEVNSSYGRCKLSKGFLDTFYDILLASSPDIEHRFRDTDFPRQQKALKRGLTFLIMFSQGSEVAAAKLDQIGEIHDGIHFDIRPDLYPLWTESLMQAIARHDSKFNAGLEKKWRKCLAPGLRYLASKY